MNNWEQITHALTKDFSKKGTSLRSIRLVELLSKKFGELLVPTAKPLPKGLVLLSWTAKEETFHLILKPDHDAYWQIDVKGKPVSADTINFKSKSSRDIAINLLYQRVTKFISSNISKSEVSV